MKRWLTFILLLFTASALAHVPARSVSGLDLSGGLGGAGGIGGLLARTDHRQTGVDAHAYYHFDGNGNVVSMINTNRTVVARYSYDPFGNILAKSGPLADVNLYRFSSKEQHPNSGLVYYLYRYYEPSLQRWVNRDPIEEAGGINLYAFVYSDPMNELDSYGECAWVLPLLIGLGEGLGASTGTAVAGAGVAAAAGVAVGATLISERQQPSVAIFGLTKHGPFLKVGPPSLHAPTKQPYIQWKPGIYFVGDY